MSEKTPFLCDDHEDSVPTKVLFYVQHSRSSSTSSDCSSPRGGKSCCSKVSGSSLCKVSALVYLIGCVLVSALYVAVYGQSQQFFVSTEEVWVPGKPTQKPPPSPSPPPSPVHFRDSPYTEWISQRWTYHGQSFSDWPTLPSYVDTIQQVSRGAIGKTVGVWLVTESQLLFAENLNGTEPTAVEYVNVSDNLGLDVMRNSRVAVDLGYKVYLITPENVTLLDCSQTDCVIAATSVDPVDLTSVNSAVVALGSGQLWIGSSKGLFVASRQGMNITLQNMSDVIGPVLSLAWRTDISNGQRHTPKTTFYTHSLSPEWQYNQILHSSSSGICHAKGVRQWPNGFGLLAVGTPERLYFYDGTVWWFEWVSVWYNGLGGVIDGPPTGLTFTQSGELFISNNVSISRLNVNYTFDRIGPLQGLPYNEINTVYYSTYSVRSPFVKTADSKGTLWIGTEKGYALLDVTTSEFKGYFYGPRWHSGQSILGFAPSVGSATVMLTDSGIAVVYPEYWTLKRKASHYQAMLMRHTRPPGLVADCPLTDFIPDTCAPSTTDNDGLWTSWLVASEAFRYQVTKDPDARANAWALFQGMHFLVTATGVRGLPARSVVTDNVTVSGDWHESTTKPGWKWKGDTSSDEVVGHMFAYPIVYDLVAEEPEEKKQVAQLIDDIVGYIKNNSYYLIDVTNRSTTWGVWNPHQINLNRSWSDEHGVNSLQILSFLLSAYRVTGKEEYFAAWRDLFDGYFEGVYAHYGRNMINQKITFPRDDNFSDDELAFLPYFVYFHSIKRMNQRWVSHEPSVSTQATLSLERAWSVVGKEKSSAWTAIYSYAMGLSRDPGLVENLVWNLQTWPLELVEWRTINSHRLDITFNPEQDRDFHSHSQSVRVLPANERTQLRWNGNPYQLDGGGASSEMDPGAWLMPYWFARWMDML